MKGLMCVIIALGVVAWLVLFVVTIAIGVDLCKKKDE
jgi:hypothetical protein